MQHIECKNKTYISEVTPINKGYSFVIGDDNSDINYHIKVSKPISKDNTVTIEYINRIANSMKECFTAFDIVMEIAQKYQSNNIKVTKKHILTQDNISIYFDGVHNENANKYRIIKDNRTYNLIAQDIPIIRNEDKHILAISLDDTQKTMTASIIVNNGYIVYSKTFNTVSTAQKHVRDFIKNFNDKYNEVTFAKWNEKYKLEKFD